MDGISVPKSLDSADATLRIADALEKLTNPSERKKIESDIISHHALNETEAKKASDARTLIKQHQDILNETNRVAAQNKKDSEALSQELISFKQECESERVKISAEWSKIKDAAEVAKNLHAKAEGMINSVASREDALRTEKQDHAKNVQKLAADTVALEEKRKGIEKFQQEVLALDNETKSKVEKLKQFNF